MPDLLNIMIADADSIAAGQLKELCTTIPGVRVVGMAHSKGTLLAKAKHSVPDLVLLSLTAKIGGPQVVDTIKRNDPDLNVIALYKSDDQASDCLINALEMGAYECIEKPDKRDVRLFTELRLRLLTITGLLRSRKRFSKKGNRPYKSKFFMSTDTADKKVSLPVSSRKIDVVAIASSTGGPEILSRIFSILPGNLNVPILLVQHIPENITQYFAKSLNAKSELDIRLANHGDLISASTVYLAPGGAAYDNNRPGFKRWAHNRFECRRAG